MIKTACVVGVVSVAPTSEMSGQGRVLAQLLNLAGPGKGIVFSDAVRGPESTDKTNVRLTPAGPGFATTIRTRAAEIAVGAGRSDCTVLVGCSGSPYDLAATALAARYLNLPFVAYLFDDPIFQWQTQSLRAAATRLHKIWLPLASTVIVPNEFLAEDWRKRGAASVSIVRNVAADFEGSLNGQTTSLVARGTGLPIIYTGSVYHAQADAFRSLLAALEEADDEFHLHLFTSQAPSTVADCGLFGPNVTRHDHVTSMELPGVLSAASILFLPLGFDTGVPEVIRTAAPAKLGDYLQSGRPILAHVPADSFVAHFCRQHECAVVVDKPDIGALASAVRSLAAGGPSVMRMVANAKASGKQFNVDAARQAFWSCIESATQQQPTVSPSSPLSPRIKPDAAPAIVPGPRDEIAAKSPLTAKLKVLLVDFDIYATIGGGQKFYRKVIERNPGAEFRYLSRGPDMEKKRAGELPENAVPILLRQTIDVAPFMIGEPTLYFPRWLQHQAIYIAASVLQQHFDVVDVPSYVPVAGLLRHAFRLFGATYDRMAVSLLGWLSVGVGNAYAATQLRDVVSAMDQMESDSLRAADLVYTISDLHRHENTRRHDRAIEVLDMHDTLDPPKCEPELTERRQAPDLWFIGRLDRNKGPDLFVQIVARLPRRLYGRCFVSGPDGEVFGTSWSAQLVRRARLLGIDLTYEGTLDDEMLATRAFGGGSVVVISSRADSFNYVALEAISTGTPVLLSEAAGAAKFLSERHPELPVMTMRPDDIDAAATTLADFLRNYRANALAFRRAVRNMKWPQVTPDFQLRLYRRAAATPHPASGPTLLATTHPAPAVTVPYRGGDTDDPLLTIIVPTYRRPEWLVSCLASLAAARPRKTRVLVVDDGSPREMNVPAIVAAYTPFAESISIANEGESNAMNVGLSHTKTPFAMMLGDDDLIEPSWPAEAIEIMRAEDAVAVYPDWAITDTEGQIVEEHRLVDCTIERLVCDHWCLPGPATVFRCRDALAIGGRNRLVRFVGDYDFYLRLSLRGRLRHAPRPGGYWRLHHGNASMARSRQLASEHIDIVDLHLLERSRAGKALSPHQSKRARATAQMAAGVILARDGDRALSDAAFAKAWRLDPDAVLSPPANLAAYPQFYPEWLQRMRTQSSGQ